MIKCTAELPKIPKYIAFEALADINIRKKWDEVIWNLKIVEEDLINGKAILYYNIKTPSFMKMREIIVSSKVMKDFPRSGSLALHYKTIDHPRFPENP